MNRRRFILGTSAAAGALLTGLPPGPDHAIVPPAQALFLRGGGTSAAAPVQVASITYRNLAAAASPSPTPSFFPCWFTRGQVPSGQIVTPYVAGSPLATWQADNRVFWDDGSLMGARFAGLLPSIAASGTVQIVFKSSAGSWSNTSSVGLATVTSESDFKVALTNFHTAQILAANNVSVGGNDFGLFQGGLTIGGGAISGVVTQFIDPLQATTTLSVQQGHGSGASVNLAPGGFTIAAGGSGYLHEGVSNNGQFSAGFNAAVALFNANGNYNGVRIEQYAKGPVLDAWQAVMPLVDTGATARPHTHAIFYVERWKTAGGALAYYRAMAHIGLATNDDVAGWFNGTFDLDWKSGATVIRGTSNSSPGYTTIFVNQISSVRTYDAGEANAFAAGRMDWFDPGGALAANDTALKAIVQERTPAEWAQFVSTGLMLPFMTTYNGNTVGGALTDAPSSGANGFSVSTPPSTQAAYNPVVGSTSLGNGTDLNVLPRCRPMAMCNVRTAQGSGGAGHNEGWYPENIILYGLALLSGDTTAAHSWLLVARGGCASYGAGPNSTPFLDPTGFRIPNTIPAGVQTFGTMPDASAINSQTGTFATSNGYTHQLLCGGSGAGSIAASLSPYHLPRYEVPIYLIEGEQWMLNQAIFTAGNCLWYPNNNTLVARSGTLGATAYHGLMCGTVATREFGWSTMTLTMAAKLAPTVFADGSTNQEQAYLQYCLEQTFQFLTDFVPFVGNVQLAGSSVYNKAFDWSNAGFFGLDMFFDYGFAGQDQLFDYYIGHMLPVCAYVARDVTNLKKYLNYFIRYFGGQLSYAGAIFMADGTIQRTSDGTPATAPVQWWQTGDPAQTAHWPTTGTFGGAAGRVPISLAGWNNQGADSTSGAGAALTFTSGNPVISVTWADNGTATGVQLLPTPTTVWPNGSAIMLTLLDVTAGGNNPSLCPPGTGADVTIPTNFSGNTWYFIGASSFSGGSTGTQTFSLYDTQANALAGGTTGRITPGSTVCNVQFWGLPASGVPANTANKGVYDGDAANDGWEHPAVLRAFCALAVAYGFTASGDTADYPALDTLIGAANAIATGFSQTDQITGPTAGGGVGITFKDTCLYANADTL